MWIRYSVTMPGGTESEVVLKSIEKITEHKNHLTAVTLRGDRFRVPKKDIKSVGWKNYQEG